MSYCIYYVLYCKFSGHYVCEEREDCWQYTVQDSATRFDSLEEAAGQKDDRQISIENWMDDQKGDETT